MKSLKKSLKARRAFSSVVSALILMLVAVAAGAVIYSYAMGWLGGATQGFVGGATGQLQFESVSATAGSPGTITIYVRNVGQKELTISRVYVDGANKTFTLSDHTLSKDEASGTISVSHTMSAGQTYEVKVTCEDGTTISQSVQTKYSTEEASQPSWVGDGSDGVLVVSSTGQVINDYAYLTGNENAGDTTLAINDATGFSVGDEILIIQIQNSSSGIAGTYEFKHIASINGNEITLSSALNNSYFSGSFDRVGATASQIVRVPQYTSVTVNSGSNITAPAWDGYAGGIVVFRATETVTVNTGGSIDVSEKGYRGGAYGTSYNLDGYQGESYLGKGIGGNGYGLGKMNNAGGGGSYICGGGGEYGGGATDGDPWTGGGDTYARKGAVYGAASLSRIFFGSGGGGQWDGADDYGPPSEGGDGGGIIIIYASSIVAATDSFLSNGETTSGIQRGSYTYGSSGGAGGSIYLCARTIQGTTNFCRAVQGLGNHAPIRDGGDGGVGRIRLDYESLNGTTDPSPGYTGSVPS
jgi:hypothetical protein